MLLPLLLLLLKLRGVRPGQRGIRAGRNRHGNDREGFAGLGRPRRITRLPWGCRYVYTPYVHVYNIRYMIHMYDVYVHILPEVLLIRNSLLRAKLSAKTSRKNFPQKKKKSCKRSPFVVVWGYGGGGGGVACAPNAV